MIVRAFHLHKARYQDQVFSGEGAWLAGGRWNRSGTPMVYCSESVALATLEILVNLEDRALLPSYRVATVTFDERVLEELDRRQLPRAWRSVPATSATRDVGERWVAEQRSAVLKIPSAVVTTEFNYLLNPLHPDFVTLNLGRSGPYPSDSRLRGRT